MACTDSIQDFFGNKIFEREVFDRLKQRIELAHPESLVKVQKTQISFCDPKPFCWAWLPIRYGIIGRPDKYIVVTFVLDSEIGSSRFAEIAQPYPGHWTYHVIVSSADDIDDELMSWISDSHFWRNSHATK